MIFYRLNFVLLPWFFAILIFFLTTLDSVISAFENCFALIIELLTLVYPWPFISYSFHFWWEKKKKHLLWNILIYAEIFYSNKEHYLSFAYWVFLSLPYQMRGRRETISFGMFLNRCNAVPLFRCFILMKTFLQGFPIC